MKIEHFFHWFVCEYSIKNIRSSSLKILKEAETNAHKEKPLSHIFSGEKDSAQRKFTSGIRTAVAPVTGIHLFHLAFFEFYG
jgi:hypothetical protein